MKTSQLDEVDRQLLHALTVAPRASLTSRLAELPGLQSVETAPIIGTIKRVGVREAV